MIQIKHYSFDLWMTLIKSNPAFKMERAKFFYKNFNNRNKTIEEVIFVFRQVDLMCNAINEKTGKNIDAEEMYLMVVSMINDFDMSFAKIDLLWLYTKMEELFFNYLPTVYSVDTVSSLDKIRQKSNCTFNISSNTAFVKGKTLKTVLSHLGLSDFFEFQLYSDEIGLSKPCTQFFESMIREIKVIGVNKNILLQEIVHIGDNAKADIDGALLAGIKAFQINSNNSTIVSLLN
jgi:putative hydrolase of the HAD superfamily